VTCALVALALAVGATAAGAEGGRRRTGITIVASDGTVVGPAVGFGFPVTNLSLAVPIVPQVAVDLEGRLLTLGVLRTRLVGSQFVLFFTEPACQGAPFLASHGDVLPQVLVRQPGLTLYVEEAGALPADVAVASRLDVDPFIGDEVCVPEANDVSAVPAVSLGDLSARFPPPYASR
jgi:hypothetical protein